MSAGRVSKLVPPSAGKRNVINNNNNGNRVARLSPKPPAVSRNDVGGQSTTSKSSSVTSSSSSTRLPRSGGGEDYVAVQYVNGHCTQTPSSGDAAEDGRQCAGVTSLEQQQQEILAAHLQVSRDITARHYRQFQLSSDEISRSNQSKRSIRTDHFQDVC